MFHSRSVIDKHFSPLILLLCERKNSHSSRKWEIRLKPLQMGIGTVTRQQDSRVDAKLLHVIAVFDEKLAEIGI